MVVTYTKIQFVFCFEGLVRDPWWFLGEFGELLEWPNRMPRNYFKSNSVLRQVDLREIAHLNQRNRRQVRAKKTTPKSLCFDAWNLLKAFQVERVPLALRITALEDKRIQLSGKLIGVNGWKKRWWCQLFTLLGTNISPYQRHFGRWFYFSPTWEMFSFSGG